MKQINFNDHKLNLTEDDIDQLVIIITYRCSEKTKRRVRSILSYNPSLIPIAGILNRLIKEDGHWEYCAGQSYPDEVRLVRELILKG